MVVAQKRQLRRWTGELPPHEPLAAVVGAVGLRLNLAEGEHPRHATAWTSLHEMGVFGSQADMAETLALRLPLVAGGNGHHIMEDTAYLGAMGQVDVWPFAPMFVRDLAGRVVHTGLNPLPAVPAHRIMPLSCQLVPDDMPGRALLEKVFLTGFRRLEWGCDGLGMALTGRPDVHVRALYAAPHAYPYKLRVDTFYQDGFRLPQVERLFVHATPPDESLAAGDEFLSRWNTRTEGMDYTSFHEANGGTAWFDDLFNRGCTVIPTVEAYNGSFKVTDDFGITDVWAGCVVEGLHDVVEYRPDTSPAGTILSVIQPGYVTAHTCVPARVIASDGSGYVSPNMAPDPLRPDPRLPHPRLAPEADVWLPTHPGHFEIPALWDWNAKGHFQQTLGPLWDPVHYVYTSTAKIIRAFRHGWPDNPALAPVPDDMLPRFHPVCALVTYDTVNTRTGEQRRKQAMRTPLSESSLDIIPLLREVAGVGYHPLPWPLEYELDPAVFPELSPVHHSQNVPDNVAPLIQSTVTIDEAQKVLVVLPEPARHIALQPALWPETPGDGMARYRLETPLPDPSHAWSWCYVPDIPTSELMVNVKRFFGSKAYRDALDELDVTAGFMTFREESLAYRRLRHRLIRKYGGFYLMGWWRGDTLETMESATKDTPDTNAIMAEMMLVGQRRAVVV